MEKRRIPKIITCIAMAVVFGVVASAAFQTTNYISGKVLKNEKVEMNTAEKVSSTKISKVASTETNSDIANVAQNAMPSVVSITNMSVQEVQDFFFGGTRREERQSSGSGIIIGQNESELLIATNNHVVEGSKSLTVSFIDGSSVEAKVKGKNAARDLAVVSVDFKKVSKQTKKAIKVATLGDSSKIKVGEQTIAIGNALGYGQSVTAGIVSAKEREINMEGLEGKLIQTDAAINPGNSGGALLNANGEVIGINTAKVNDSSVEGMGYAIPITDVSNIIENLMNQKTRDIVPEKERGYLGIQGYDVTEDSSKMYNMPQGVFVYEVINKEAADRAGITKGSIITELDGVSITGMDDLKEELQYYKAGEKVKVTIRVPGKNGEYEKRTVVVQLAGK